MKNNLYCTGVLVVVAGLVGCGPKDEPYKTVDRSPYELSTSDIDKLSDKTFLYRRMIGETPRYLTTVGGKMSSQVNDIKVVKLVKTENGLQIAQVDSDVIGVGHEGRFNTDNNLKPILTIGGSYVDYKCSEDSYNKCTNREEVNNSDSLTWDKKRYFVPDFSKVTIAEQTYDDLFDRNCSVSVESKVLAEDKSQNWKGYFFDLDKGIINFEIKSTYTVPSVNCIARYSPDYDIDNLSFTSTQYFSVIARDELVSADYKSIPYQQGADRFYGYFTNRATYRSKENLSNEDGTVRTYLRRFNPNRKDLTYYLSNTFWDKKNAIFLAAAKEAEAVINVQNKMYDTGLPPVKFEQAHDKRYGDLRYNTLRLFDQPLDNGLLGVANISSDPTTGEIVSGGFNQFSGNFLSNAYHQYNVIANDYNFGRMNPEKVKEVLGIEKYPLYTPQTLPGVVEYTTNDDLPPMPSKEGKDGTKTSAPSASYLNYLDEAKLMPTTAELVKDAESKAKPEAWGEYFPALQEMLKQQEKPVTRSELASLSENVAQPLFDPTSNELVQRSNDLTKLYRQRLQFFSENNILVADAANLGGAMRTLPKGVKGFPIDWKNPELWIDGKVGMRLKKINQLPKSLRSDMVLKTAGVGFVGTLIHEFGHSIGLAHNFHGSNDYKHFFSQKAIAKQKAELAKVGYPNSTLSTDSTSTMEYNVDMMGMGFGPYDLAAIRFAYKREIQDNRASLDDWNNPKNWHSLKKFDEQRRAEWAKGEDNGATRLGPVAMLSDKLEKEIPDLKEQTSANRWSNFIGMSYCSDGGVTLNYDCNRFDVGFDIDQISQYYIERYLNRYESRNLRNNRRDFHSSSYESYIPSRVYEFSKMHEVIEDNSGLEDRLGVQQGYFSKLCSNSSNVWFCTNVKASERITKFFFQVVTQPDAQVVINFRDKKTGKLVLRNSWSYSLDSFQRIYNRAIDDSKFDKSALGDDGQIKMGQVISQYSDAPKWFDEVVFQVLVAEAWRDRLRNETTPVVKVVGRRLNSSRAMITDPEHPYSNERDSLGVWPDRLIAMQQLVTRHTSRYTSDLSYSSLVDYGPANRVFKGILCRMATGYADSKLKGMGIDAESECNQLAVRQIQMSSDIATPRGYNYQTMKFFNGKSWNGIDSIDDIYPIGKDIIDQYIEPLEPYLTPTVQRFGFAQSRGVTKGKTNFFAAMLNQIALYSTDSDSRGQERARRMREFVGLHPSTDNVSGKEVTLQGRDYIITNENILAKSLISEIEKINKLLMNPSFTGDKGVLVERLNRSTKAIELLPVL